jgi:Predicted membrane protein
MNWILVFISGLITYFLRYSMISLIKKDMLSERTKTLLGYVPSAVFPALILHGCSFRKFRAFCKLQ